eukprot:3806944-Pyramimonas_sp.AAC.1
MRLTEEHSPPHALPLRLPTHASTPTGQGIRHRVVAPSNDLLAAKRAVSSSLPSPTRGGDGGSSNGGGELGAA